MSGGRSRKQRTPDGPPPPPVVQRLWLRYRKTGRLRFMSHRDYTRVFERAIRRAGLPIGFSAGFTPHPKISWVGAAPTGIASVAEYVEIGLSAELDPADVLDRLRAALPEELAVEEVIPALGKSLADRVQASRWRFAFPGESREVIESAVAALWAADDVVVERVNQNGRKQVDVRGALVEASVQTEPDGCVIMTSTVRQATPVVRPDDVFTALREVAGLEPQQPPSALRLAQGSLDHEGQLLDPFEDANVVIAPSPAS
ncbi:TIGR03936 family radical SAM-associated protein [Epidermidibacterium keratini]|nr:TIGR03936 family radical SAM-associated protein [Epidermidibacterium keratini]